MRDEQRPSLPFTLEEVTRAAQEILLAQGHHAPTVILEGNQRTIGAQLEAIAPTSEARAQQMFSIGLALAQMGDIGVLQQVFFVSEAWLSSAEPGKPLEHRPSQDPKRKEVVIIAHRILRPPNDEVIVIEMKRDPQGVLTNLEALAQHNRSEDKEVSSPLIEALILGFLGSNWAADD